MPNFNKVNQIFIRCSSHTLCGIKPANLFTLPLEDLSESIIRKWRRIAARQGFCISAFKTSSNTMMVFIYDIVWMRKILCDSFVQAYLRGKGYSNPDDTCKTLKELFHHLKADKSFPHEVGIFLGYPLEDVISFEETQGHNCKYCGYWKSYCNPEEAKKCCARYKQCSELCLKWFEEGYTVPQIIKKYKETALEAA